LTIHSKYVNMFTMTHNNYPIRRIIAAGAVLAGGISVEACSADDVNSSPPAPTVTETVTHGPTSEPTALETSSPTPSPEAEAAAQLEDEAVVTAKKIIQDAAYAKSRTEAANVSGIGFIDNKRTEVNGGPVPYIKLTYDSNTSSMHLEEHKFLNPGAPEKDWKFQTVELGYKLSRNVNKADKKIAAGRPLNTDDFSALLGNAVLQTVDVDYKGLKQEATYTADDVVEYTQSHVSIDSNAAQPATVGQLESLKRNTELAIGALRQDLLPGPSH
jgi:hypothetical protein